MKIITIKPGCGKEKRMMLMGKNEYITVFDIVYRRGLLRTLRQAIRFLLADRIVRIDRHTLSMRAQRIMSVKSRFALKTAGEETLRGGTWQ
jgi:hypothetical protein